MNLMTRGYCWDHIWSWTGGQICVCCRRKHITKWTKRPELEGVNLTHRLTKEEWEDLQDVSELE